ncbi:solute carrier family 25 member 45-like [Watersipora subatra]|uniref:solute carrier family 25 member 45-like n=1 Tax=Watersipora subatra TaxID=2589382 RepID=UPI00355C5905
MSSDSGSVRNVAPPGWLLAGQAFFAGWIAGGAGVLAGHPLDTVKTLQQTQTKSRTSIGSLSLLKSVWTEHGARGFYKGLTYPLVTYGAVNAAFFAAVQYSQKTTFFQSKADENGKFNYYHLFLLGSIGGLAQVPVVSPTELVKIKLQDQINTGRRAYSGSIDCTIKLWKKDGTAYFLRGLSACTARDVYAWGFYWLIFETVRKKMIDQDFHYVVSELVAGGLAGFFSWASATPLDVVKSRMQASETKLRFSHAVNALYAEEGLKAFTRGMLVSSIRGIPSNSVTLFGFSQMMRWCNAANESCYGD